jgi:hypothetical protein
MKEHQFFHHHKVVPFKTSPYVVSFTAHPYSVGKEGLLLLMVVSLAREMLGK